VFPALDEGSIDLLPMHAVGQHRKRVAQIDHLIKAVTEKVNGHGAAFKNSQKTGVAENLFERFNHPDSPQLTSLHSGFRTFAVMTNQVHTAEDLLIIKKVCDIYLKELKSNWHFKVSKAGEIYSNKNIKHPQ